MRTPLVMLALIVPLLAGCLTEESAPAGATGPLTLHIGWTPESPVAGEPVTFEATLDGAVLVDVDWDFGDGATARATNPEHTFDAGTYTVQARVQGASGREADGSQEVHVQAPAPVGPAAPEQPVAPPAEEPEMAPADPLPAPTLTLRLAKNHLEASFEWDRTPSKTVWEFGDGTRSGTQTTGHDYEARGTYTVTLTVWDGSDSVSSAQAVEVTTLEKEPHVLIAIPDSGINPYHDRYYRPERTEEPCTYLADFPCGLPALELSVGKYSSWDQAFQADKAVWDSIQAGVWYWIPQTVFVAVSSESCDGVCILDDTNMHGTGTTSSALMENPDAVIAFKEGSSEIRPFLDAGLPVDVFSVSWGFIAPIPAPGPVCLEPGDFDGLLYVKSSGNEPGVSSLADCWSGKPSLISVGGGYAADRSQEPLAYKEMDIVSYYCRPTAQTKSTDAMRSSYCGTSFSAPTAAGAISKVILGLRQATGYTGTTVGGMVAPDLGITLDQLRDAVNRTASYEPFAEYSNSGGIPLNPVAPWTQWGWGFYDGTVADTTIAFLLGADVPEKPADAVLYQETIYTVRQALYG